MDVKIVRWQVEVYPDHPKPSAQTGILIPFNDRAVLVAAISSINHEPFYVSFLANVDGHLIQFDEDSFGLAAALGVQLPGFLEEVGSVTIDTKAAARFIWSASLALGALETTQAASEILADWTSPLVTTSPVAKQATATV